MAEFSVEEQNKKDPHIEKGFDKRIIWAMIAAGIIFVVLFIFLGTNVFSPSNTPMGNSSGAQPIGNSAGR
jgi:uncharacterized membrane protein YvbJ